MKVIHWLISVVDRRARFCIPFLPFYLSLHNSYQAVHPFRFILIFLADLIYALLRRNRNERSFPSNLIKKSAHLLSLRIWEVHFYSVLLYLPENMTLH